MGTRQHGHDGVAADIADGILLGQVGPSYEAEAPHERIPLLARVLGPSAVWESAYLPPVLRGTVAHGDDLPRWAQSTGGLTKAQIERLAAAWREALPPLDRGFRTFLRLRVEIARDVRELRRIGEIDGLTIVPSLDSRGRGRSLVWRWPLMVGLAPGEQANDWLDAVRASSHHGYIYDAEKLRPDHDYEIAIVRHDGLATLSPDVLAQLNDSACVIVAGEDSPEALLADVQERISPPIVVAFTGTPDQWWTDLFHELTHDCPVDVAAELTIRANNIDGLTAGPIRGMDVTASAHWFAAVLPEFPELREQLRDFDKWYWGQEIGGSHNGTFEVREARRRGADPKVVVIGPRRGKPATPPATSEQPWDMPHPWEPPQRIPGDEAFGPPSPGERGPADAPSAPAPSPSADLEDAHPGPSSTQAWPLVDAPEEVEAGDSFTTSIGLRRDADPDVEFVSTGRLPTTEDVGVTVVVDGFEIEEGTLEFTVNLAGTAVRDLKLRAVDDPTLRAERTIGVRYTVGGALRAYAMRAITVNGAPPAPEGTLEVAPEGPITTQPVAGADPDAPTLELTLQQGDDVSGRVWQWTIASKTLEVPSTPPEQLRTLLDDTARDFQAKIVREGSGSSGQKLFDRMLAIGRRLSELLPDAVIAALRAAAEAAAPEPPSVLLVSSEPRIPWELAVIENPPLTEAASPFLCAQVHMGRWVMGRRGRPPVPPASARPATTRAVVVGDYSGLSTWNVLPQAAVETATLVALGAQELPAEREAVRDAVHGTPPVDILHFATHGRFLEGQSEEGLVLVDRSGAKPVADYFTPDDVEAGELEGAPLVFLNSCQVGAGEAIIGDYAGMAAAFLRIGATAVIAPLWEVDDTLAAEAARDFYAAVPASTVGSAVSALRGRFTATAAQDPDTKKYGSFLAYQYFGHPNLSLAKEK